MDYCVCISKKSLITRGNTKCNYTRLSRKVVIEQYWPQKALSFYGTLTNAPYWMT